MTYTYKVEACINMEVEVKATSESEAGKLIAHMGGTMIADVDRGNLKASDYCLEITSSDLAIHYIESDDDPEVIAHR